MARIIYTFALILALTVTSSQASAEDFTMCAAVVPCDGKGNVIAPFDQDPFCAAQYAAQCKKQISETDPVADCSAELDAAATTALEEIEKSQKEIKKLKRALRQAKLKAQ